MLSATQEARVLDLLGDCPSGTMRTYCLDHLAAAVKITPARAADLLGLVQVLRARGDCEIQCGGFCDADGHDTEEFLVWRSDSPREGTRALGR